MRWRSGSAIAAAIVLIGCAESHVTIPPIDAGRLPDGAPILCELAGLTRCDGACGVESDGCRHAPLYEHCISGVCIRSDDDGYGRPCGTHFESCRDGLVCVDDPAYDGGVCIEGWRCDEAASQGYPLDCRWWDGTPRTVDPPPAPACPPAPYESTPFCGAGCAPCPIVFSPSPLGPTYAPPGCFGISDTRGLGICGVNYRGGCERGLRGGVDVCRDHPDGFGIPELMATNCVCLVTRGHATVDDLSNDGWATSEEGCRAYRTLYPDEVECVVDREWTTLP